MKRLLQLIAAITFMTAWNLLKAVPIGTAPLCLAVVDDQKKKSLDEQIAESLDGISKRLTKVDEIEKAVTKNAADYEQVTKLLAEMQKTVIEQRKHMLEVRDARVRRGGEVTDGCAKFFAAVALRGALIQEKLSGSAADAAKKVIEDVIGKTALTSSDIPLPTQFSGEVVELVSEFGAARKYGTVYPLGAGTVKLPRLGTDPTFGLIAGSGSVPEKSPTLVFVTFSAEKFGGLVRLPTEIDEDSIVPMGQFLARYGARQIAYVEDYNFFRSTGAGSGLNGTAEGLTKAVVTNSKTVALATGDLAINDVTLAKVRTLRAVVDAAILGRSAYYFHPTMEQKLASFNTSGDKPYVANGLNGATLDGFPIRWVDVLPPFATADAASTVFGLFGDASFNYLGVRGGIRMDVSKEAGFTTDEILVRVLERLTVGLMATGAVAGIVTAAS